MEIGILDTTIVLLDLKRPDKIEKDTITTINIGVGVPINCVYKENIATINFNLSCKSEKTDNEIYKGNINFVIKFNFLDEPKYLNLKEIKVEDLSSKVFNNTKKDLISTINELLAKMKLPLLNEI